MAQPPQWSDDDLKLERDVAEQRFVAERKGEGPANYFGVWDETEPKVRKALNVTNDLRNINPSLFTGDRTLWQLLRYVCAPRVSEEDLWTLVGKKFKAVPVSYADRTAKVFEDLVDAKRFPWVVADREYSSTEYEAAVMATTTLLAHEQLGTNRRRASSKSQEQEVSDLLESIGCSLDPLRKPITALDELARGSFSRERKVGGSKCDIPIRLRDGRLLALECKVSNGPKNSWKRLQREVGGKAESWRSAFGAQVLTGATLAGVFDLKCLSDAQNLQHVSLFWQHDLRPLVEFIKA